MLNKLSGMKEEDKDKIRKPIVKELQNLFKKFGQDEVMYTLRWYSARKAAEATRKRQISKLKKEIASIKNGKIPSPYC